jgi:hypothetical protein
MSCDGVHYMEVSGQLQAPVALLPEKKESPVPIWNEAGWPPEAVAKK